MELRFAQDRQQSVVGNGHGERQLLLLGIFAWVLQGGQLPEVSG